MEFYLVDDLECDLTIFHPYRTLMALCGKEGNSKNAEAEAGEVGVGVDDGPRYWGTGEGKLLLQEGALQMAWYISLPSTFPAKANFVYRFIINDTYRSDLHLLYPPHLIAIAAVYLTLVLHASTKSSVQPSSTTQSQSQISRSSPPPRRSSRMSSSNSIKKTPQDIIGFMAGLNISLPLIATIAQEIISLYTLWDRYNDDKTSSDSARGAISNSRGSSPSAGMKRNASGTAVVRTSQKISDRQPSQEYHSSNNVFTPISLTQMFLRMRERRIADLTHPASGRPPAVN
jgi:cyclin-C